jgi:serine/threonine protein kinase
MYTLMFHRPPFDDGMKLAQMNGIYKIPTTPKYSQGCINILKRMLTVNPDERITAHQVYELTLELSGNSNIDVNGLYAFGKDYVQEQFKSILAGEEIDLLDIQYSLYNPGADTARQMQVQGHQVKEEAKQYESEPVHTKVNKVMEFLVNSGSAEAAIQEKLIRGLTRLLHSSNPSEA